MVFFDELGVEWQYEVEGFEFEINEIGKVMYLPDFYIPKWDKYIEIKPKKQLTPNEFVKSFGFVQKAEKTLLMIVGDPWPYDYSIIVAVPALDIVQDKIICSMNMQKSVFGFGYKTNSVYLWDVGPDSDESDLWPLSQPFSAWKDRDGKMGRMWVLSNEQLEAKNLPIIDDLVEDGIEVIHNADPVKGHRLDDAYITARQYRFEHRGSNASNQFSGH